MDNKLSSFFRYLFIKNINLKTLIYCFDYLNAIDNHPIMQQNDYQLLEIGENNLRSKRKFLKLPDKNRKPVFVYLLWLGIAGFFALNLYMDYICSTNIIIPQEYVHVFSKSKETSNEFKRYLIVRSLSSDSYQCESDKDCNHGTCHLDQNIYGNVLALIANVMRNISPLRMTYATTINYLA